MDRFLGVVLSLDSRVVLLMEPIEYLDVAACNGQHEFFLNLMKILNELVKRENDRNKLIIAG